MSSKDFAAPVEKAESGLREHWNGDILVVGADPLPLLPNAFGHVHPPAGWMGEVGADSGVWTWGVGNWFSCGNCRSTSVFHEVMTWAGRPCGHYDGDNLLSPANRGFITDVWANACNDVKWRGRAA